MRARPELQPDEVWLLGHLLCARPNAALHAWVAAQRDVVRFNATWGRVLDPAQPAPQLPERTVNKPTSLAVYIAASLAEPEDRALRLMWEYVSSIVDGLALTHQLMALLWWEEMGRALPARMEAMRPVLLDRIRREHAFDDRFSDLYAERAMLLARFGDGACPPGLPKWTDVVLDAQGEGGGWVNPELALKATRGHVASLEPSSHTSVLALGVLQAYVDCMDPHAEASAPFVPWRGYCGKAGPWSQGRWNDEQ
jgi:hypothetical protein